MKKCNEQIKILLIGFIAGIVSGLFSSGGGMILVPALTHILKINEIKARAISIASILFMVVASSFFYFRNDYLDLWFSIKCAIGGAIGGYIGSKLLKQKNAKILKILFIILIIYTSLKMITS